MMMATAGKRHDSYRMREHSDSRSDAVRSIQTGLDRRSPANTHESMRETQTPHAAERQDANSYFQSYEKMVKSQDAEDIATITHLRPIFHRIQKFGQRCSLILSCQNDGLRDTSFTANHDDTFQGHSKQYYTSTSRVLWSTKILDDSSSHNIMCDPKEILTFAAIKRFVTELRSFDVGSMNTDPDTPAADNSDLYYIQTDEQLVMILTQFEAAIDEHSRVLRRRANDFDENGITFSEFVHVYKTIISGMKALQMLPSLHHFLDEKNESIITPNHMGEDIADIISNQREKTVDRSLKLIKEFTHFSTFSPITLIPASDDEILVSGSNDINAKKAPDVVNTTHRSMVSRSVSITSESDIGPDSRPNNTAALVDMKKLPSTTKSESQAAIIESVSNLKENKERRVSLEGANYGMLSIFGLLIFVACVTSAVTYQMTMSWMIPSINSPNTSSFGSCYKSKGTVSSSLENEITPCQKSEDNLARAVARIGTMMLQLEDLNDEITDKTDALSICNSERLASSERGDLLHVCQADLERSRVNMHVYNSSDIENCLKLDSQYFTSLGLVEQGIEERAKMDDTRQKVSVFANLSKFKHNNIIGMAANIIRRISCGLLKFIKVVQRGVNIFSRLVIKIKESK